MLENYDVYIDDIYIEDESSLIGKKLITRNDKSCTIEKLAYVGESSVMVIRKDNSKPLPLDFEAQKYFKNLLIVKKDLEKQEAKLLQIEKEEIKQIYESQNKRFLRYLSLRNVKHFYHFTAIVNIPSILKHGLMTRDKVDDLERKWINDYRRLDETNGISLSISFPNYRMFYKYREKARKNMVWVVLELDPALITENDCLFLYTNASSTNFKDLDSLYSGLNGVKKMFDDNLKYSSGKVVSRPKELLNEYPTDPEAEIMVLKNIPVKFIKRIIFNSYEDQNQLYNQPKIESVVDPNLFKPRADYLNWQ